MPVPEQFPVQSEPFSAEEMADTLAAYGLKPRAATATKADPDEVGDTLKAYGITAKPSGKLEALPSGKVVEAPEQPPTAKEKRQGEARGLRAQAIGGIPIVGPAVNLLEAALPQGQNNTFSQRLYDQRRADEAFAAAHPLEAGAAQLAGSALGYGGLARAAPIAFGLAGPTLGARLYGGAIGGGTINALDAAMRGENPVTAAEIGAAGGLVGPLGTEGARAATGTLARYAWPLPGPLKNVPRSGVTILSNALEGETPLSIAAGKSRMGPAGFFGDVTPGLTDVTGAIADLPGPGKALIREAYAQRADQQGNRIEGALTRAMGPRINVIDQTNLLTDARKAAADPLYEQWRTMQVHPTPEIKALIPRLESAGAFDMAEKLSGISGEPINRNFFTGGSRKDYPTTQTWDYVKRGLDAKIDQAYSSGDKTTARALLNLKGDLISEIEKTPAGKVWQQARSEFADRSALIDQLAAGRDTFIGGRSGTSVDEFREELSHLSKPELMARIQGARDVASEAMGASKNGDTTLRNKLLAENNQKKLRILVGRADADELIKALKQEEFLGNQTSNVLGNLQTGASGSMRSERKKMFQPPELPSYFENINLTQPASLIPPSMRPHNVLQGIVNAKAGEAAPALAPIMLTRNGPQIDELINAISSLNRRVENVNALTSPWYRRVGGAISGPGQAFYRRNYERQNALQR